MTMAIKKERINEAQRRFQKRRRVQAIIAYGGKCECCQEGRIEFLTIVKREGGEVRGKSAGLQIGVWLWQHKYPEGYGVECLNCAGAHRYFGYCPHRTGTQIHPKEPEWEIGAR